jgi:hypothetical protein
MLWSDAEWSGVELRLTNDGPFGVHCCTAVQPRAVGRYVS